jgi:hypothetical protein
MCQAQFRQHVAFRRHDECDRPCPCGCQSLFDGKRHGAIGGHSSLLPPTLCKRGEVLTDYRVVAEIETRERTACYFGKKTLATSRAGGTYDLAFDFSSAETRGCCSLSLVSPTGTAGTLKI